MSATFWNLYASESEINDKKYVESLRSKTESMVFLVREHIHCFFPVSVEIYHYPLAEHLILRYRRDIHD